MYKKRRQNLFLMSLISGFVFFVILFFSLLNMGFFIDIHFYKSAKYQEVKIACVGDSITYGYGVVGWFENNYPKKLNKFLGDGFCVNNFGYSSRTASFKSSLPYKATSTYTKSLEYEPNVVIVMLGTNDATPKNWISEQSFYEDYKAIISSYQTLPSNPKVIVMSPIPSISQKAEDPDDDLIKNEIRETVKKIADEENLCYIDMYEEFSLKTELYRDGLHPNAKGAENIAEIVCRKIKEIL